MTKVKICGITNIADAKAAARLGADFIGFNFYPKSPRFIDEKKAIRIAKAVPSSVKKVGIFVNEDQMKIMRLAEDVPLDLIQLSGDEDSAYRKTLKKLIGKKIIQAVRIGSGKMSNRKIPNADFMLLDSHKKGLYGGTGVRIDPKKISRMGPIGRKKLFLAGGLTPNNVGDAIRKTHPYAVDVCSGIEKVPGKKDILKMKAFFEAVS